jgi:hypothetical protein
MPETTTRWRHRARAGLAAAVLLAALWLTTAGAQAASAYSDPFAGDQPSIGRTDMGVDVCLKPGDPIRAVGNGIVVGVIHNWYDGEPYLWYELNSGPQAWHFVYVAEQIRDLARPGQAVHAGQPIARFAAKGTCIETGWSAPDGRTLAQATTGYHEGEVTAAGVSFAHFLVDIGVPGRFEIAASASASQAKAKAKAKARTRHARARRAVHAPAARRLAQAPAARRRADLRAARRVTFAPLARRGSKARRARR